MPIFENFEFCIGCNFGAKCPFLMLLGLNESIDIDFFKKLEILKKYSLSSEIQLVKVGRISEISEKSPNPRQDFVSGAPKSVHSQYRVDG